MPPATKEMCPKSALAGQAWTHPANSGEVCTQQYGLYDSGQFRSTGWNPDSPLRRSWPPAAQACMPPHSELWDSAVIRITNIYGWNPPIASPILAHSAVFVQCTKGSKSDILYFCQIYASAVGSAESITVRISIQRPK